MAARLTPQKQSFCDHYLRIWNGTNAAILAGYSIKTAYSRANKLLNEKPVQEYIQARLTEAAMGVDEVLMRLAEQARAEYAQFFSEDGLLDLKALIRAGKGHLIKKIKITTKGTEIEFYDAQHALELIGKKHRLFVDRQEVDTKLTVIGLDTLLDKVYGSNSDSTGS